MELLLASADASLATLMPRMLISMLVVIATLWGVAKLLSNRGITLNNGPAKKRNIKVVAKQPLSRKSSLLIVEIDNRTLLVGSTDASVNFITELETKTMPETERSNELDNQPDKELAHELDLATAEEIQWTNSEGNNMAWKNLIGQVRERTIRH